MAEAVRGNTAVANKMASKGENLGSKQEEDHLRQTICVNVQVVKWP